MQKHQHFQAFCREERRNIAFFSKNVKLNFIHEKIAEKNWDAKNLGYIDCETVVESLSENEKVPIGTEIFSFKEEKRRGMSRTGENEII